MSRYASTTTVSVEKSRREIERTLERYGAMKFGYAYDGSKSVIQFELHKRHVRFLLTLPDVEDDVFWYTQTGIRRERAAAIRSWEQACRQSWRALALVIKSEAGSR
jgi:hypothetical protein